MSPKLPSSPKLSRLSRPRAPRSPLRPLSKPMHRPNISARLSHKPTRSGLMAQPVMARNSLTHRSRPYRKKGHTSSDSVCSGAGKGGTSGTKAHRELCRGVRMAVHLHEEDLPAEVKFADGPIAVDTEAMGLVPGRDRLCLVQLSDGKGDEHLVRFSRGSDYSAPNL